MTNPVAPSGAVPPAGTAGHPQPTPLSAGPLPAPRFDTLAVHGIYGLEEALRNQGSLIEPLFLSPAQHFPDSAAMARALAYEEPGWIYSRIHNPTLHYLEGTLALLEAYGCGCAAGAVTTGSGMSAIFMATNPLLAEGGPSGRPNFVASARCYGGTYMLFQQRYAAERGIEVRWVRDPLDLAEWASRIDERTRFVYGEMPSNPGLAVFDIAAVADLAHAAGVPLLVDSTVATPALLRPLGHGADVVIHSLSKAIACSGFAIAGALVARRGLPSRVGPEALREDFAGYVKLLPFRDHGPALSPFNALMALQDLRTLRPRLDRWSQTAAAVARFLASHPAVEEAFYPGLASHPGFTLAHRYLRLVDTAGPDGAGEPRASHLLAFTVRGGPVAAARVFDRLRLIYRATDLGRIKSVATIPAISTHQQQGEAGRNLAAIPPHLIRLSVGGEDPADLLADLDQALAAGNP